MDLPENIANNQPDPNADPAAAAAVGALAGGGGSTNALEPIDRPDRAPEFGEPALRRDTGYADLLVNKTNAEKIKRYEECREAVMSVLREDVLTCAFKPSNPVKRNRFTIAVDNLIDEANRRLRHDVDLFATALLPGMTHQRGRERALPAAPGRAAVGERPAEQPREPIEVITLADGDYTDVESDSDGYADEVQEVPLTDKEYRQLDIPSLVNFTGSPGDITLVAWLRQVE